MVLVPHALSQYCDKVKIFPLKALVMKLVRVHDENSARFHFAELNSERTELCLSVFPISLFLPETMPFI